MWLHRNSFIHKDGGSVHALELEAINQTLRMEFILGRDGLSGDYASFFRGSIETLLEKSVTCKQQWLASIWAGRDCLRLGLGMDEWQKDPLARAFIDRFKVRKKRKTGIG